MPKSKRNKRQPSRARLAKTSARLALPSIAQVCAAPEDFLDKLDVAAINLMCAGGLPGAEKLDIDKLFDWLDNAARQVDLETRRHWYRFLASPSTYNNSAGYFCCYFLLQVLQEDFGVKYNPERAVDPTWQDQKLEPNFNDSRDLFIHGIIDGDGGTCGSIPVVYVAVGRRLGYPLKLVEARGHLFIRWDDPSGEHRGVPERFNVDGAGPGIASHPDDYYHTWPVAWTVAEKQANCYLRSLTPKEELAAFMATRAACLEDIGRFDEAAQAYRWACGLVPHDGRPRGSLNRMLFKQLDGEQLYQYVTAINRQNREQRDQIMALASGQQVPLGARSLGFRGHHPHCGCLQCQELRNLPAQAYGHTEGCTCFQCRQAQQSVAHQIPGHPIGCGCYHCRQPNRHHRLP